MPRPRPEIVAIEHNELCRGQAFGLHIAVSLRNAFNIQRKPNECRIVPVAAPDIEHANGPIEFFLERRNRVPEDSLGEIRDDVVEPIENAIVLARVGRRINPVEICLARVDLTEVRHLSLCRRHFSVSRTTIKIQCA